MSRNSKKKLKLFKPLFLAVVLTMFVGTIFFAIDTATSGAVISKLQEDLAILEKTNRELSAEVVKYSSVSAADTNSVSLGFARPEKTVYLTIQDALEAYAR